MIVNGSLFREIESNSWNVEARLAECDAAGVGVQVLSTVPVMFSYWAEPDPALELARHLNDHIAGVVAGHPARFVGLGTIPMQSPDLAIRELERCVRELGLSGVEIGSNVNGANLDSPELFPIFEAAAALGAAVFVHPWEMAGRDRMTRYWLPWLVGMPAETSLAICSLIFGGVLERLPALRIAFAHGGGAFPATIGRIVRGFEARPDLCAVSNDVSPREYLRRIYRRLARARSADAALPRGPDGRRSDRPRQRLSLPARRGSPGRADRFVRIPGGDPRAAAARHGARVARSSRRRASAADRGERAVPARTRLRGRAGSRRPARAVPGRIPHSQERERRGRDLFRRQFAGAPPEENPEVRRRGAGEVEAARRQGAFLGGEPLDALPRAPRGADGAARGRLARAKS